MLVGKAVTEAEESQRLLLFALNALAGIARLQGNDAAAAAAYR